MLQITRIKQDKLNVINGLKKKKFLEAEKEIERVLALDQQRRETKTGLDNLLAESNQMAIKIGQLIKEGKSSEAEEAKAKTSDLKRQSKDQREKLSQLENQLNEILLNIPNIPHPDVPQGTDAVDNEIIYQNEVKVDLTEGALPHWELVKKYDIIDFELGNKITGAGFPVYKNKGARIQRALVNFFLDQALEAGYQEIQPPVLINQESGLCTGQLPDKEGQMYQLKEENYYLIPTAEVPVTNIYRDSIIDKKNLPIKNVAYSLCFRREAGSWGSHVRGLNRLHQFDKVEIVQIHTPENSYQGFHEMCEYVKGLLQQLELPFREVRLCGGDLGFTSTITHDMEVYAAAQDKWLEVSSVSNFETYQSHRLKLRYRTEDKKTSLLHTLNGSALALPRVLAALLENNQSHKGVKIPKVLIPYTGFEWIK